MGCRDLHYIHLRIRTGLISQITPLLELDATPPATHFWSVILGHTLQGYYARPRSGIFVLVANGNKHAFLDFSGPFQWLCSNGSRAFQSRAQRFPYSWGCSLIARGRFPLDCCKAVTLATHLYLYATGIRFLGSRRISCGCSTTLSTGLSNCPLVAQNDFSKTNKKVPHAVAMASANHSKIGFHAIFIDQQIWLILVSISACAYAINRL